MSFKHVISRALPPPWGLMQNSVLLYIQYYQYLKHLPPMCSLIIIICIQSNSTVSFIILTIYREAEMKTTFFKNVTTCSLLDRYRCPSKVHGAISRYKSIITTTMRTSNIQIYDGMVQHEKTLKTRYNISGIRILVSFSFYYSTNNILPTNGPPKKICC